MEMRKKYKSIDEVLADSEFDLIDDKKEETQKVSSDDRLLSSFMEINSFYKKNGREPKSDSDNMTEASLCWRLDGLKSDANKIQQLKEHDVYDLLPSIAKDFVSEPQTKYQPKQKKQVESIDDILNDDEFNLFEDDEPDLFTYKHIPKETERAASDFVAKRKPCKDFHNYEHLFKTVHRELREGTRKFIDFKEDNLREGAYYLHNGVVFYLEKINITQEEQTFKSGKRIRKDGRTRCIFENGTESNMLYRSVAKILYANGKVLTDNSEESIISAVASLTDITKDDKPTGYLYILKSLSNQPKIKYERDLHKVGFCTTPVEERIKNAEKSTTYLMAPVKIVDTYKIYNAEAHKYEKLIQDFFRSAQVDIEVTDSKGVVRKANEWFLVPLEIIRQAISYIRTEEIVNLEYSPILKKIIKKKK